jgi:ABC-type transport system involved in cytochrome c biogenesis permease subunit
MSHVPLELALIWFGVLAYAASTFAAWRELIARHGRGAVLPWLAVGLVCIGLGIGLRWQRIGHGPFLNMFEILISNLFSLGLVFAVAYWRMPAARAAAVVVMPILMVLALWALAVDPVDTHLPATYQTPLLWLHVAAGKLFLGLCLIAVGLGGVICLQRSRIMQSIIHASPPAPLLDALAWRLMMLALLFQTSMLVVGAWWAQGAWGRYWAWDALETWAFATWVALAVAVHLRRSYNTAPIGGAAMIFVVFILAFLTFFGVPFISSAPHKGAV